MKCKIQLIYVIVFVAVIKEEETNYWFEVEA